MKGEREREGGEGEGGAGDGAARLPAYVASPPQCGHISSSARGCRSRTCASRPAHRTPRADRPAPHGGAAGESHHQA